jgi:hypothetical protein
MQADEREALIQLITREIVSRLNAEITPLAADSTVVLQNRLVTLNDVLNFVPLHCSVLQVGEKTIVTAAAQDQLKARHIILQREIQVARSAQNTAGKSCIAVLAPRLYRFQWQALQHAVEASPYQLEKMSGSSGKLAAVLPDLIKGLVNSSYVAAVIIDDQAISLLNSLKRLDKVLPVAGWDLTSVKIRPAPHSANLLLLPQHAFGAKKMAEMIAAWLP